MLLKKLAAGSGYEYLTRQVAVADSTELGRIGEPPGVVGFEGQRRGCVM